MLSPRTWFLLAIGAILIYLMLALYQLNLPGLYYDEALDAVPAMQVLLGHPLDIAASFNLFDREWPLMIMPYVGPTTSYLLLPGFSLFGSSVFVLRLTNIFIGALTLLLVWSFYRRFLDVRAATLCVWLLAVNPTFVFWTRVGAMVSLPLLPLAIITLWSLWLWHVKGSPAYLYLATFCLGLGITTKILFIWLAVGLALSWFVLEAPLWLRRNHLDRGRFSPRRITCSFGLASVIFLLGSLPLWIYNFRDAGTLRTIFANLTITQLYGVNNLDLLNNLKIVFFKDFPTLLDGTWWSSHYGGFYINRFAVPAFLISSVTLPFTMYWDKIVYSPRRLFFLYFLTISIVAQSAVTVSSLGATHLMILWPMPQAIIATALFGWKVFLSHKYSSQTRIWTVFATSIATVLVLAELLTTIRYHQEIQRTGGTGAFSDAIYELADDLSQVENTPIIALDWGFRRSLQFLTLDRVNPEERFHFGPQPDTATEIFINWRVTQGSALYLLHTPKATAFSGHRELFEEAAYRHRLVPTLWKRYYQRDRQPVIEVFSLKPIPHVYTIPQLKYHLNAQLGDEITLLGFDLPSVNVQRNSSLSITLYWKSRLTTSSSYKVFLHLIDDSATLWAQYDGIPMLGGYPTTFWLPGEVIEDRIKLRISANVPPGIYRLFAGMYDETTQERLPLVFRGQRLKGDTIELLTVEVTP